MNAPLSLPPVWTAVITLFPYNVAFLRRAADLDQFFERG